MKECVINIKRNYLNNALTFHHFHPWFSFVLTGPNLWQNLFGFGKESLLLFFFLLLLVDRKKTDQITALTSGWIEQDAASRLPSDLEGLVQIGPSESFIFHGRVSTSGGSHTNNRLQDILREHNITSRRWTAGWTSVSLGLHFKAKPQHCTTAGCHGYGRHTRPGLCSHADKTHMPSSR